MILATSYGKFVFRWRSILLVFDWALLLQLHQDFTETEKIGKESSTSSNSENGEKIQTKIDY
jgi:hypothetical protein